VKNVEIIKDACELAGIPYPKSHTVKWEDKDVWDDIIVSPVGIFQFESDFAYDSLKKFKPQRINDLSLVNAALRPSGTSYRDRLLGGEINKNPSEIIDKLLEPNKGFLVFQEDTIAFLQNICGLSGGDADNVRRAIGRKQKDRLEAAMPQILEGYCKMSPKSREIAEQEAKEFLQIIEDSSNYQFGFNHSTGYSMIGYLCAMLRYYYPEEFIAAYLNNANNEEDIRNGTELAKVKGVTIYPIKFRHSGANYTVDKANHALYKGCSSVKFMNADVSEKLYAMKDQHFDSFIDLLSVFPGDTRQREILIRLNYFSEFGGSLKLIKMAELYDKFYGKKIIKKDKCDLPVELVAKYALSETEKQYRFDEKGMMYLLSELCEMIPNQELPLISQIRAQTDFLGYISFTDPSRPNTAIVTDINTKYSTFKVQLYCIGNGKTINVKLQKKRYESTPLKVGYVINFKTETKAGWSKDSQGQWVQDYSKQDIWLSSYTIEQ
jgi:DNA polymerase-3 subunit alpha